MKRKLPESKVISSEKGGYSKRPKTADTKRRGLDPEMTKTPPPPKQS